MMQNIPNDELPNEAFHENKLTKSSSKINYSNFLNLIASNRKPAPTRELMSLSYKLPKETINLAGGLPNSNTFPFEKINVFLKNDYNIELDEKLLQTALQYLPSEGYEPLIQLLKKLQNEVHGLQSWNETNVIVCCGSQEGLSKTVEMLHSNGEPVIVQHPIYSGILDLFKANNAEFILAEQDQDGIIPTLLKQNLENRMLLGKTMPKIMYINPTGGNPTGITITDNRKREIYQLACEFNFLILDDDPYYFLNFSEENTTSFLSLDTEGRVIRFDSFSKILSAGLRLGFITGPTFLLRTIELHIQVSTIHPSSLSQIIIYKLLEHWKFDGFQKHTKNIKQFYKIKRDYMIQAAEKYLNDVAEWNIPTSGFFLWLRLKYIDDVRNLFFKKSLENLILFAPGYIFYVDHKQSNSYIRLSYSIVTNEQIEIAFSKLAVIIHEEIESNNKTILCT